MRPQAILHASLDRNTLSVGKFARWLRAICTMLLARNTAPDRLKAIGYIEQAIVVLEEHGGDNDDDEVITPLFPPLNVTHPFVICPVTRHIRWTSVIGCLPLAITRGLSAFSTASPYALRASFTHVSKCLLAGRR